MTNVVTIEPQTKRNAATLTTLGAAGLLLSLLLFIKFSHLFAFSLVMFGFALVSLLLGIAKLNEPSISLKLTSEGLCYFHRRGQYKVSWDNIVRIDNARVTQNMALIELPYLGLKLKQMNPVLDAISPRLATGLLTEQRPLLMTAATHDEDLKSLEKYLGAEFEPFISHGERYRGVLAMFGRRSETLAENLGYHLYISHDAIDRPAEEIVALLRQWQAEYLVSEHEPHQGK
ncbi:DUF2982 domain-containing protein [Shewanella gaetbuli]|uniref:DUF2982 domain-containing protein n=1 Tax=Shewanella gaetbuli TaxID=220752 RepID=UPI0023DEA02B|nr:DUF2982 domain-containing protein [Shewanella gaetbuli]